MNKIINKALFYKEWINVRWVTILTIITLLFYKVYGVISQLNFNKKFMEEQGKVWTDRWFNNGLHARDHTYFIIMIFVVIILATILFIGEKTSETEGFIASMPFTRKEIIFNKWLVGVVSLLISFVVTFMILSIFYFANGSGLDATLNPYWDIVRWFFMDEFQYICIFTFVILIQAVMGNSIVSSIVGGIALLVPWFITMIVQDLVRGYYGFNEYLSIVFDKVGGWLNIYSYNTTSFNWVNIKTNSGKDTYRSYYYLNYKLKLLVLFVLTCLFLYLAYVAYKRINLEYNLRLVVFKNLKPVFIYGVSICSGLFGGSVFTNGSLRLFGIWFIIFTIVGYFISKLLLKILSSKK
ncbi:ABC transporter permease subunit [Clostridium estertheticum]|uniref:ABC transporter permease subunit n=1 Tax=Clostridium estertheticum TaxID=238834 RepID=A0A7Y3T145_9CLOT|nr:ABC transporter permease subunit [Clostridium estertheticum]NNU78790.1 ABC transporter permease subunit [Clostridium estertheticum]WBL48613.1 ABC-2 transporter permease [Clostridium estertheticum]